MARTEPLWRAVSWIANGAREQEVCRAADGEPGRSGWGSLVLGSGVPGELSRTLVGTGPGANGGGELTGKRSGG